METKFLFVTKEARTAFFIGDVILDILVPADLPSHSVLPNYPFRKGGIVIFQQGKEYLHGHFLRKGSFGFLYVTSKGKNYCITPYAIRRLASPALTFDIPFPFLTNGKKEQTDHAE